MATAAVEYVQIDMPFCTRIYGNGACTASKTGNNKCFNTIKTCQVRDVFLDEGKTLTFRKNNGFERDGIEAIPSLLSVSMRPGSLSLGTNLGVRASVTITFRDHKHSDVGLDKYLDDRTYDPYRRGTFWGKFRARNQTLQGQALRLYRGTSRQTLAQLEERHYIIDSFSGPSADGTFTIVAKDALKLLDDDKALCPTPNSGFITAGISDTDTAFTLGPSGVGNAEYPASGFMCISGKECVLFTRSGNAVTIVGRARLNTEAQSHSAESRCQMVQRYAGLSPALIIRNMLRDFTSVPVSAMPLASWNAEVDSYLQRNYSQDIVEPTGVKKLISKLVEEAGLVLWWDDLSQTIKLQVLRELSLTSRPYDDDSIIAGSLSIEDQPEKRVSQVVTYYGRINPTVSKSDRDNYSSIRLKVNAQNEADYGTVKIKEIFSEWIPTLGGAIADRLNDIVLARFANGPRKVAFDVSTKDTQIPVLGGVYNVGSTCLQNDTGGPELLPVQITSIHPSVTKFRVEGEEARFDGITLDDPNIRNITIDVDSQNLNLRTLHDTLFPVITDPAGLEVIFTVAQNVIVGSNNVASPAINVGSWVAGLDLKIIVLGRIQGHGGNGGDGRFTDGRADGKNGGTALYTRYAINLDVVGGEIWSGGGGGGIARNPSITLVSGGGGGGAGQNPGDAGTNSDGTKDDFRDGTTEGGGAGVFAGGAGGDPGENGSDGVIGAITTSGGDRGAAVDGVSFVTFLTAGDRRGKEIN